MSCRKTRCKHDLNKSMLLTSGEEFLAELGRRADKAGLACVFGRSSVWQERPPIGKNIFAIWQDKAVALWFVNGSRYFQLVLEMIQSRTPLPFENMSVPTSFSAPLLFHAIGVLSTAEKNNNLNIGQLYSSGTLIGLWRILLGEASLPRL